MNDYKYYHIHPRLRNSMGKHNPPCKKPPATKQHQPPATSHQTLSLRGILTELIDMVSRGIAI